MVEEARSEAHVPAEQPAPEDAARVPQPDVHPRGPRRDQVPARQGPAPAVGLIWRIRDRATFVRLRQDGIRAQDGPLWVVFLPEDRPELAETPPRVAFALGRKVGTAVERNRLRRRLRSIMAGLAGRPSDPLRAGAYLIGARPGVTGLSYQEVELHVERALRRIDERVNRP